MTDKASYATLSAAIRATDYEAAERMIRDGADINQRDTRGDLPLTVAAKKYNLGLVKKLIDAGADVNRKTSDGRTVLMIAAIQNDLGLTKYLLDNGAEVDLRDDGGSTPLIIATKAGAWGTIRTLLDNGADIGAVDRNEMTALDWAISRQDKNSENVLRDVMAERAAEEEARRMASAAVIETSREARHRATLAAQSRMRRLAPPKFKLGKFP